VEERIEKAAGACGPWRATLYVTLVSAYALVVMEWLFFATKPSFMSALGWPAKLVILPVAPLPLLALGLVTVLTAAAAGRTSPSATLGRILSALASVPAIALFAALFLLLVDGFTTTVLRFGILRSSGPWRFLYVPVFAAILWIAFALNRSLTRSATRTMRTVSPRWFDSLGLVLVVSSLLATGSVALWQRSSQAPGEVAADLELPVPTRRPNVLLISSDGIEADHMSAYGYERRTTPHLDELVPRSLLCENAFANCARTTGTLTSILTGRLPTETRVIFPPDVLSGRDADLHLPGLLKRLGYRTEQFTIRHFADAYDLNMRHSFDRANFQKPAPVYWTRVLGEETTYFLDQTWRRVRDRILHVFGPSRAPAAIVEVQREPGPPGLRLATRFVQPADRTRVEALLEFVRRAEEPFFAQLHLMVTHGPWFRVKQHVFSPDERQASEWMVDYYDDSILAFDEYVSTILQALEREGKLASTLLVILSDHGAAWSNRDRIPLLFLFPEGEHAGRIRHNVQTTDIAPTILDYMGLPTPQWMSGRSLLGAEPPVARPIFSADADKTTFKSQSRRVFVEPTKIAAPFYTLREVTMVVCHRAYVADLVSRDLKFADVEGHTTPCDDSELPAPRRAFVMILDHLRDSGYDVSAFGLPPR
jgi:arylsulfatase A-like enzyme